MRMTGMANAPEPARIRRKRTIMSGTGALWLNVSQRRHAAPVKKKTSPRISAARRLEEPALERDRDFTILPACLCEKIVYPVRLSEYQQFQCRGHALSLYVRVSLFAVERAESRSTRFS